MANNSNNNSSYVGAPYNFVPFADKTYAPVATEEMAIHDKLSNELVSGEISYNIEAKNPVLVDSGNGHFYRNEYNQVVIPGSTMRGLIRSNAQILSMADISKDVDDYYLMYRHVAAGALKKEYNDTLGNKPVQYGKGTISVLTNVKAGAITCKGGEYYIHPTKIQHIENNEKLPNYYVLSERTVVEDYLNDSNSFAFDFFVRHGKSIMQHEHDKGFRRNEKNGRTQYIGTPNKDYKPYSLPCSFEVKGKNVIAVSAEGKLENKGTAISTGKMQNKKAIYIVPEIDDSIMIPITEKDVKAYNIDYARKENTLSSLFDKNDKAKAKREAKAFYGLPEEGRTKVVFYIQLEDRLYFGFTPRLRVFYNHSIKEGLRQEAARAEYYDLCESIFGLSDDKRGSFKSKVSFADALLTSGEEMKSIKTVLAEPKPSSYLDYIIQNHDSNKEVETYNSEDFRIRGVKQYWLHEGIDLGIQNTRNDKVGSELFPYMAGSKFTGVIRFNNLTSAELGLLLWALKLDPDSQMNVGKGKPYGLGRIEFSNIKLKTFDYDKAYNLDQIELNPFKADDPDKFISEYKKLVVDEKQITDYGFVKNLLRIKNSKGIPNPDKIRYMSIDAREYQGRKQRLKDIDEVLDDKEPVRNENKSQTNNGVQQGKDNNQHTSEKGSGDTIMVTLTKVFPDRNDPTKLTGTFNGGMVFDIPSTTKPGDKMLVRVNKEKDGRKYTNFVEKK